MRRPSVAWRRVAECIRQPGVVVLVRYGEWRRRRRPRRYEEGRTRAREQFRSFAEKLSARSAGRLVRGRAFKLQRKEQHKSSK